MDHYPTTAENQERCDDLVQHDSDDILWQLIQDDQEDHKYMEQLIGTMLPEVPGGEGVPVLDQLGHLDQRHDERCHNDRDPEPAGRAVDLCIWELPGLNVRVSAVGGGILILGAVCATLVDNEGAKLSVVKEAVGDD